MTPGAYKPRLRLLVVDDDDVDRMLIERLLGSRLTVTTVPTAEAGLRSVAEDPPDCVLLDYRLPGQDGFEFLDRLGKGWRHVPVIMLTGSGDERIAVRALKTGALDYLTKEGLDPDELEQAIYDAVDRARQGAREEAERRKLEDLATRDALTGLFNRRYLAECLDDEIKRVRRYGSTLSVLLLDVDRFKDINDSQGHLVGDRVADVLREAVRDVDVPARWGGDEFCVLLPATDGDGARRLGERLRTEIRESAVRGDDGDVVRVTASIGVATASGACPGPSSLVGAADRALYEAKAAGRDRLAGRSVPTSRP